MKSFRLGKWGSPVLPLGTRPQCLQCRAWAYYSSRWQSAEAAASQQDSSYPKRRRGRPRKSEHLQSNLATATAPSTVEEPLAPHEAPTPATEERMQDTLNPMQEAAEKLKSPPTPSPNRANSSAKLSALHARLALPSRLPLPTLMRALIHPTADASSHFNNASLAILGNHLLGYYMAEHLLVHYPRLPMAVLFAAQQAYVGPASLASVAQGWGIEVAAEPGSEVDPGLLQFKRALPGTHPEQVVVGDSSRPHRNRRGDVVDWRRGMSSRVVYDDEFGELQRPAGQAPEVTTLDRAATQFVRALAGAVYLHAGSQATHKFFKNHILSRQLELAGLFTFTSPLRDLSRLCAREGFDSPVARLESETGRLSRHPVFVVGVYSGRDRLGVDAGSSLDEARFKAAVAALKGWYLYSPVVGGAQERGQAILPSEMEGNLGPTKEFRPSHVDYGEVVA
ncbi:MAG: hypothetical protein Q9162_000768 [Coniocarpon cinnabarinum]